MAKSKKKSCPNCKKKLGIFKTGILYTIGDKRFCSIKCKREYPNKLQLSKKKSKNNQLSLKVKVKKRGSVERITIMVAGIFLILLGIFIILISIPLLLIIVGIIPMFGGAIAVAGGYYVILLSTYKNEAIICPNCRNISTNNYGILKLKGSFKCERCEKLILINYGK